MLNKTFSIAVSCFIAGWSLSQLSHNTGEVKAQDSAVLVYEQKAQDNVEVHEDKPVQGAVLNVAGVKHSESVCQYVEADVIQEHMVRLTNKDLIDSMLDKLALDFEDTVLQQAIKDGSIYQHIEEGLTQMPVGDERRLPLIVEYLDAFNEQVGDQFAADLLYETQYQPPTTQQRMLEVIQGFAYTAYENGNHAPLEKIVQNLSVYQQSDDDNIRLSVLAVLDSAIDDIGELKIKIAPFMDDVSPKVRYKAKAIMAALDFD